MTKLYPNPDRFFSPDPTRRTVANLPLVCPNGHVDPNIFVRPDYTLSSPTELLLISDHYIFRILYSSDDGTTWTTADIEIEDEDYTMNLIGLPPGNNYLVRVIATDGVNTGEDVSDAPFSDLNTVFLPAISKP